MILLDDVVTFAILTLCLLCLNLCQEFDELCGFGFSRFFAGCLILLSPVVRVCSMLISCYRIGVDAGIFRAEAVYVDVLN